MQPVENVQNSDLQTLQEELERRYGPAVAQDIMDKLNRTPQSAVAAKTPDYMDVKAMSELQERFRAQAMLSIWKVKEWRRAQPKRAMSMNLVQMEGALLMRQCQDSIKLYRLAHKSYYQMYRTALAAFSAPVTYAPITSSIYA